MFIGNSLLAPKPDNDIIIKPLSGESVLSNVSIRLRPIKFHWVIMCSVSLIFFYLQIDKVTSKVTVFLSYEVGVCESHMTCHFL